MNAQVDCGSFGDIEMLVLSASISVSSEPLGSTTSKKFYLK